MTTVTAKQIRAARALLDWSQTTLSERSHVGVKTIQKMEKGLISDIHPLMVKAVSDVLSASGIVFVDGGVIASSHVDRN
jgi:DNA-binding XRE family transcriptional regulator